MQYAQGSGLIAGVACADGPQPKYMGELAELKARLGLPNVKIVAMAGLGGGSEGPDTVGRALNPARHTSASSPGCPQPSTPASRTPGQDRNQAGRRPR